MSVQHNLINFNVVCTTVTTLQSSVHPRVGACGSVVYRCVNKKKRRERVFFRAGQCAELSSFRIGKMLFL